MSSRASVQLGSVHVGDEHPVAVVAELGVNHLGDYGRMVEMIDQSVAAGAHLLKFQTYTAETRYDRATNSKANMFIDNLARWEFTREQEARLWQHAQGQGAVVFTSPFDADSATFAVEMGTVGFKLASFEVVNLQFVRALASHGLPVSISRGMTSFEELDACVKILEDGGCEVIILHCVSSYPLMKRDSNLRMIHTLRDRYDWPIGHSDHTRGCDLPPLAVAAGASMIEKHFTINPKLRESDNPFSVTPDELREILFRVRQVEGYMGDGNIEMIEAETYMREFRRQTA